MINTNFWLTKSYWKEYDFSLNYGQYLKNTGIFTTRWNSIQANPGTGSTGLGYGVLYDRINPNVELDKSNIFWGINGKSEILNPHIIFAKGDYTDYSSVEIVTDPLYYDENPHPVRLAMSEVSINGLTPRYFGKNFDYRGKWGQPKEQFTNWGFGDMTSSTSIASIYKCAPINEFNYKNIVIAIYVTATNKQPGENQTLYSFNFSLEKYFNSEYKNYPIIIGIYYKTYYQKSNGYTGDLRSTGDYEISFLTDKKFPGSRNSSFEYGKFYKDYVSYCPTFFNNNTYITADLYNYDNFYDISEKITKTNGVQFRMYPFMKYTKNFVYYKNDASNDYDGNSIRLTRKIEITKEEILKEFAYLGLPFTSSEVSAKNGVIGKDDLIYLPVFDDDNITTGEYLGGEKSRELPNYNWDNSSQIPPFNLPNEDINFTPTEWNVGEYSAINYYYLTTQQFKDFLNFINQWKPSGEQLDTDFKGVNPTDYIQQAIYYPVFNAISSVGTENIFIGPLDTELPAMRVNNGYGPLLIQGNVLINKYFDDFRDYPPYTSLKLYTVFGSVDLDVNFFMGHNLTVLYAFDWLMGSGIAYICRDNVCVSSISGSYGIKIPLTATMAGQYQSAYEQSQVALANKQTSHGATLLQIFASAVATVASIPTANPLLIGGSALSLFNSTSNFIQENRELDLIDYTVSHSPAMVGVTGSSSNNVNVIPPFEPYLIITRCKMTDYNEESYSKTVGYACIKSGKLKDFNGLTVCANIDTNGLTCTAQIKAIIQQLCRNGIYL